MSRDAAIIEANHTRLRPILMTTVMLIAAMVPIALGQGPGAGARASMAKVIIGGQLLSLLLALLVTPVTYSLSTACLRPPLALAPQAANSTSRPPDRTAAANLATNDHPYVLLIVADDLGCEALGCYGGLDFSTPHLDRLASEGMWLSLALDADDD
jgi:hypothetical protein